jgi:hypothetical protein
VVPTTLQQTSQNTWGIKITSINKGISAALHSLRRFGFAHGIATEFPWKSALKVRNGIHKFKKSYCLSATQNPLLPHLSG